MNAMTLSWWEEEEYEKDLERRSLRRRNHPKGSNILRLSKEGCMKRGVVCKV
jgi:hypothetical protein